MSDNLMAECEHDAMVDTEAWKLLLSYAESGLEDDIDEEGKFDEAAYEEITERAWDLLRGLKKEHVTQ